MKKQDTQKWVKVCKNCGEHFEIPHNTKYNAKKYCCNNCKREGYLKAHYEAQRNYMKRYKDILKERSPRGSNLGNCNLKGELGNTWEEEEKKVKAELKRLKLTKWLY